MKTPAALEFRTPGVGGSEEGELYNTWDCNHLGIQGTGRAPSEPQPPPPSLHSPSSLHPDTWSAPSTASSRMRDKKARFTPELYPLILVPSPSMRQSSLFSASPSILPRTCSRSNSGGRQD